ncbi:MAG: protease complex subunit PrcB family protein [Actinomycetota bacterium]|nr:protease complex subunit PrcB family protein [Actinomycetota bacterium]
MRNKIFPVLISILILALLSGCGVESAEEEIDFETLARGYNSSAEDKDYYVVADQQTFGQISEKIDQQQIDNVDFGREMVIAVFQGRQSTGGYEIEVEKVVRTAENLKVYINETVPDPSDMVTQALTCPYHLIKLPKVDLQVEFID